MIVAGKYGSTLPDGTSYTENEYNYAILKKIPVLPFLHKDTNKLEGSKLELDNPTKRERLQQFRKKLEGSHGCNYWIDGNELASRVTHSLNDYAKEYPAIGWIRGDVVPEGIETDLKTILEPCKSEGIRLVSPHGLAQNQKMDARKTGPYNKDHDNERCTTT